MQSATTFDKTKCATTSKVTVKINFLVKYIELFSLLICISYRLWCMKQKVTQKFVYIHILKSTLLIRYFCP